MQQEAGRVELFAADRHRTRLSLLMAQSPIASAAVTVVVSFPLDSSRCGGRRRSLTGQIHET